MSTLPIAPPLRLDLTLAPLEAFDAAKLAREDMRDAFTTRPDIVGFTEVSPNGLRDSLLAVARAEGYRVYGGNGDTAVAVRRDIHVTTHGSIRAHSAGKDEHGSYGPRFVDWVQVDLDGERITVAVIHRVRPLNANRRTLGRTVIREALALIQMKSRGTNLGFILGDFNEDDTSGARARANDQLERADVTTFWDRVGEYPATGPGGGTIDWAANPDADTRVTPLAWRVHPRRNADHHRVTFIYNIRRAD